MRRQRLLVILNPAELDAQPEPALERAVFLARETGAGLEIFVSEPRSATYGPASASAPQAAVGDTLARLAAIGAAVTEAHGLSVATDAVFCRHPFDGIMQKVASTRPDMVVKTTRHDTRLNRTFFNYTDWHLIRACPRPLLLVKSEDPWETRRIVACVDPAHVHSHAETLDEVIVEAAHLLAYRLRGELHIFHSVELMIEPVFSLLQPDSSYALYKRRMGEAHYGLLNDLLRRYGIGAERVHLTVGRSTETLVEFTRDIGASLVVMGAVSKGALELLLIGNTAEKVLDDLSCDILVVKSEPLEARVVAEAWVAC